MEGSIRPPPLHPKKMIRMFRSPTPRNHRIYLFIAIFISVAMAIPGGIHSFGGSGGVGDPPVIATGDPPARSGKTIIVDCNGNGDYTTIQEALKNASNDDTIRIYDGIYSTINSSNYYQIESSWLTIIGNNSDTIIRDRFSIYNKNHINIMNLSFYRKTDHDIIMTSCDNIAISNVSFMDDRHCITMESTSKIIIANCTFNDVFDPIFFQNILGKCNMINIVGNVFEKCNTIRFDVTNLTFKGNTLIDTYLEFDMDFDLPNNLILDSFNTIDGVPFVAEQEDMIFELPNTQIILWRSWGISFSGGGISSLKVPIYIIDCHGISFRNTSLRSMEQIYIYKSDITFTNISICSVDQVYVKKSHSLTITDTLIENSTFFSYWVALISFLSNEVVGYETMIDIVGSMEINVEDNLFRKVNSCIIVDLDGNIFGNYIFRNNRFSEVGTAIRCFEPGDYEGDCIIANNMFQNVSNGIEVSRLNSVIVKDNVFVDTGDCIANYCYEEEIAYNRQIRTPPNYNRNSGIISYSKYTDIYHNYLFNKSGISLYGCIDGYIHDNNITNCDYGVKLSHSSGIRVHANRISNNRYGLYAISLSNSMIDNNYFFRNVKGANLIDCDNAGVSLNLDYPNGGNYWSDYNGGDRHQGPDQKLEGSDGFGDYPYSSGSSIFDEYPIILDRKRPMAISESYMLTTTINEGGLYEFPRCGSDDNMVMRYVWEFEYHGEEVTMIDDVTGPDRTFLFDHPDIVKMSLTAYDFAGNYDRQSFSLTVKDCCPPTAICQGNITAKRGDTVHFDASKSYDSGNITQYRWIINDHYHGPWEGDTILYGIEPSFTCNQYGVFRVDLEVKDSAGHRGYDHFTLSVPDLNKPVAEAGVDITINNGETARFDGGGSKDDGVITQYRWSFQYNGSVVVLRGMEVKYSFTKPGYYIVNLDVKDGFDNKATDQLLLTVVDTIKPVAVITGDLLLNDGQPLDLEGHLSYDNGGIVRYVWSFDDDGPVIKYGSSIHHEFETTRNRVVTLTVYDEWNNAGSISVKIWVIDSTPPYVDAGPDLISPLGSIATFNGSLSWDRGAISQHVWSFFYRGGGMQLVGEIVPFRFEVPGSYEVTLTVTDWASNIGTDTLWVTVEENGTVTGIVIDYHERPIDDAVVDLISSGVGFTTKTDDYGSFSIDVPAGEYTYRIYKAGYHDISGNVTVRAMETSVLDLPPMDEAPNYTWIVIMAGLTVIASALAIAILVIARSRRPKMKAAPPIWAVKVQQQVKPSYKPIHKGTVRRPGIVLEKDNKKIPPS